MNGIDIIAPVDDRKSTSVDASVEQAATIEISLAKRIVKPGSNRIVCLAAQTTVPICDNENASVSDLALRLPDGTNVVLSMSLFNELNLAGYEGFSARYVYDPDRYNTTSESKFAFLFTLIAVAAIGSFFSLVPGAFDRLLTNLEIPHVQQSVAPTAPPASSYAAKQLPTKSQPRAKKQVAKIHRAPARTASTTRSKLTTRSSKPAKGIKSLFVPPPPPTAYFQLNQIPNFDYAMPPYMMAPGSGTRGGSQQPSRAQTSQKETQAPAKVGQQPVTVKKVQTPTKSVPAVKNQVVKQTVDAPVQLERIPIPPGLNDI